MRVTKKKWYALGGFKNSDLYRKADRLGRWSYFEGAVA